MSYSSPTNQSPTPSSTPQASTDTVINMPSDPTPGEFYIAENGVRYVWDEVKWNIADEGNLALWTLDASDGTLTPTLSGYGVKVNKKDTGERASAIQEEGYDVEILPRLTFVI